MWLSVSASDQFVAHLLWERDVQQPVAVDVPEFPAAQTKLQRAEAVRLDFDPGPLAGRFDDAPLCPSNRHGFLLS
jgi:hypothetical protein